MTQAPADSGDKRQSAGRAFGPARLVMLLQDLSFGGTQRQALELARALDPDKYRPEIWVMTRGRDFAPLAANYGVPAVWLSDGANVGIRELGALRRKLIEERGKVDILLPLTAIPTIWGRIFGRLAGYPAIVGTCRGGGAPKRQHERFLKGLAHRHICNSQALADIMTGRYGLPAKRVTAIPNGVDIDFFTPPPEELRPVREVILCVARFCEDKDHETLLQAFALTAERFKRAELWLVGNGPLAASVTRQVARHPARSRIRAYPGGDPRPFYQQASILTLSSVREGLPNVILEGMAMGLPVAATRVGGVPEAVEEGVTGLLAPARDPAALAGILDALLADEPRRLAMGRAGREKAVSRYSLHAMARAHEAVFDALP